VSVNQDVVHCNRWTYNFACGDVLANPDHNHKLGHPDHCDEWPVCKTVILTGTLLSCVSIDARRAILFPSVTNEVSVSVYQIVLVITIDYLFECTVNLDVRVERVT